MTSNLLPLEIRQVIRNADDQLNSTDTIQTAYAGLLPADQEKVRTWAHSHLKQMQDSTNDPKIVWFQRGLRDLHVISQQEIDESVEETEANAREDMPHFNVGDIVLFAREFTNWFSLKIQKNDNTAEREDAIVEKFANGFLDIYGAISQLVAIDPSKEKVYWTKLQHPADEPQVIRTNHIEIFPLITQLFELDAKFANLTLAAKAMTSGYPPVIPVIEFSESETQRFTEAQEKIKVLETHLKDQYKIELIESGWHGRFSFHRILWQDEQFIAAIQDPLVVKIILSNAKERKEKSLPGDNKLSDLMFYGLGSNRIAYLLSAAPNWNNRPPEGNWAHLHDLNPGRRQPETPRILSSEYLNHVERGLEAISQVLVSDNTMVNETAEVNRKIDSASIDQLLAAFRILVDTDTKIRHLTYTNARMSTLPGRMAGQCFEVMTGYQSLLDKHQGDHVQVLGYGLVSQALDAKHLAAAIYLTEIEHLSSKYFDAINRSLFPGKIALMKLLNDARNGKLNSYAACLLKIRLQQIMTLIIDNRNKMGIELDSINQCL